MPAPRSLRLALLLGLALAAPARAQPGAAGSGRAPDGLLARPELQAIVDAQVERDAARLIAALGSDDAAVRARAAFALASVQDTAAVPGLLAALDDSDPRVRADAAFALGQTADSTASVSLLAALDASTDLALTHGLLEALGKTGGHASLVRLAAREVPQEARGALALALARTGLRGIHDPRAVERLVALLADPASGAATRADAAYYFGRVTETAAWAPVADSLRAVLTRAAEAGPLAVAAPDPPSPVQHLVAALGRLADPRDDPLLVARLSSDPDWRVRVNAARALAGRTASDSVRAALLHALDDPSVHVAVEAATALSAADSLAVETQREIGRRFIQRPEPWQVSAALMPALVKHGAAGVVLLRLTGIAGDADRNPAEQAKAMTALGLDDGSPGFKMLAYSAAADNPQVAAAAVAALGERFQRGVRSEEATVERYYEIFAQALRRRDLATATAAAPLLADSLFQPLGATDLLAGTLREMRTPEDIEPMVEVLNALGATGDPAARAALEAALAHPHPVIRRSAAAGLTALTGAEVPAPAALVEPPERRVDWPFLESMGRRPRLVLETGRGRIAIELEAEEAPLTVQTILQLASAGRYDGVPFHRVVPNFVIQGGDFERGDGFGGPGFAIRSEFTRIPYDPGTVGMASAGKDTEGSQYFVTHSMQPHLDGRYTAFGRVVEGLDVVDAILEGDRVERAIVEPDRDGAALRPTSGGPVAAAGP